MIDHAFDKAHAAKFAEWQQISAMVADVRASVEPADPLAALSRQELEEEHRALTNAYRDLASGTTGLTGEQERRYVAQLEAGYRDLVDRHEAQRREIAALRRWRDTLLLYLGASALLVARLRGRA